MNKVTLTIIISFSLSLTSGTLSYGQRLLAYKKPDGSVHPVKTLYEWQLRRVIRIAGKLSEKRFHAVEDLIPP